MDIQKSYVRFGRRDTREKAFGVPVADCKSDPISVEGHARDGYARDGHARENNPCGERSFTDPALHESPSPTMHYPRKVIPLLLKRTTSHLPAKTVKRLHEARQLHLGPASEDRLYFVHKIKFQPVSQTNKPFLKVPADQVWLKMKDGLDIDYLYPRKATIYLGDKLLWSAEDYAIGRTTIEGSMTEVRRAAERGDEICLGLYIYLRAEAV